jgi:hypothetical protein
VLLRGRTNGAEFFLMMGHVGQSSESRMRSSESGVSFSW